MVEVVFVFAAVLVRPIVTSFYLLNYSSRVYHYVVGVFSPVQADSETAVTPTN